MERHFEKDLNELKERLLWMGSLAERAVHQAVHSVLDSDEQLAKRVLDEEDAINELQLEIDDRVVQLLALHQLMAMDLRLVLAISRINNDLERIGDQAVNIAQRVFHLVEYAPKDLPVDIPAMASKVRKMVRDALQCFIEGDADKAKRVLEADDEADRMNKEAFANLSACMQEHPDSAAQALDALSIARNLERVADHATNIAEDVIFWIRGADVRHHAGQSASRI